VSILPTGAIMCRTKITVQRGAKRLALAKPLARHHGQKEQEQRFRCSEVVVRGGVEPPTFRFSGQALEALC
jgi:hypothetical protein